MMKVERNEMIFFKKKKLKKKNVRIVFFFFFFNLLKQFLEARFINPLGGV
jgi:hypothetical protein